jgi:acyl carrier protein
VETLYRRRVGPVQQAANDRRLIEQLVELSRDILGLDHVDITQSLVDLGLDSLSALEFAACLESVLGFEDVGIDVLFSAESISELAQQLEGGFIRSSTAAHEGVQDGPSS